MKFYKLVAAGALVAALMAAGAPAGAEEHGGRPFRVEVSGANEVPATAGGDADRGTVLIEVNLGQSRICWTVEELVFGSGGWLPSHGNIYAGSAGVIGGPVVTLFGHDDYPQSYPTGESCVENLDQELLKDMLVNPQNYYVRINNHQYPSGFARGQLAT